MANYLGIDVAISGEKARVISAKGKVLATVSGEKQICREGHEDSRGAKLLVSLSMQLYARHTTSTRADSGGSAMDQFSQRTIDALADVITGGSGSGSGPSIGLYRSAYYLEQFFKRIDVDFQVGSGSRVPAVKDRLLALNETETDKVAAAIEAVSDPRDYLDEPEKCTAVVDHLNKRLKFDGYELRKEGELYKLSRHPEGSAERSAYPERYWHCHVILLGDRSTAVTAVMNDATFGQIEEQVVKPWYAHREFVVAGQRVRSRGEIDLIRICQTPQSQSVYAGQLLSAMSQRNIRTLRSDRRLLPFHHGVDYTHELLYSGELSDESTQDAMTKSEERVQISDKVFVVHGHDNATKDSVARTISDLGLSPIILHERPSGGRTLIEKIENYADVGFAVVLLTPDDLGKARDDKELSPRARQNVILELGFFIGLLGRHRVCALRKGEVEFPSDFSGVVYRDIDDGGGWRLELAREMQTAGLDVDLNKLLM